MGIWKKIGQWFPASLPRPTPAAEILPLVSRMVRLPILSIVAGRDMWVRIRAASPAEINLVTWRRFPDLPPDEAIAKFNKLPLNEQRRSNEEAEAYVETFLRAVILQPAIAPSGQPVASGSICYEAVRQDRFHLVKEVLVLSGSWFYRRASADAPGATREPARSLEAPAGAGGGQR